jgi:predicted anti-sigma-YlaC factor YlaD
MNCREIKRKLSAFQDNELPDLERQVIEHHLNNCTDCSIAFQEMNEAWELLSSVETIESAPYFWIRLARRMSEKERKQPGWNFIFAPLQKLSFSVLIIGVLIFGLGIGIYLGQNIYQHSQLTSNSAVEQEIDQVFPLGTFDDFPDQSIAQAYVTLLSENNH